VWPAGVVYFADGNPIRTDVRGAGGETIAWVTGAGHEGPAVPDNLAARFPRVSGSLPEIALLHASVEGSANLVAHDRYAPCSKGDLEGKGYDYWALGHVHRREALLASPPAHYPGSVLGLDRTETGEKGALLVEVRRGEEPRVLFRPTAPVAWREMDIDAAKIGSVESLRQIIAEKMRYETIGSGALLVARLRGASPLADSLGGEEERSRLESEFKDELGLAYLSLRTEDLRRAIDVGKARVGPIAAALDLAASLRDGKEPFDAILRSDLAASVAGEARESTERLRRLLEGADEEIVFRMWRERS
jgi:DNA repair exonuclease SbcCD nuclease subunit